MQKIKVQTIRPGERRQKNQRRMDRDYQVLYLPALRSTIKVECATDYSMAGPIWAYVGYTWVIEA